MSSPHPVDMLGRILNHNLSVVFGVVSTTAAVMRFLALFLLDCCFFLAGGRAGPTAQPIGTRSPHPASHLPPLEPLEPADSPPRLAKRRICEVLESHDSSDATAPLGCSGLDSPTTPLGGSFDDSRERINHAPLSPSSVLSSRFESSTLDNGEGPNVEKLDTEIESGSRPQSQVSRFIARLSTMSTNRSSAPKSEVADIVAEGTVTALKEKFQSFIDSKSKAAEKDPPVAEDIKEENAENIREEKAENIREDKIDHPQALHDPSLVPLVKNLALVPPLLAVEFVKNIILKVHSLGLKNLKIILNLGHHPIQVPQEPHEVHLAASLDRPLKSEKSYPLPLSPKDQKFPANPFQADDDFQLTGPSRPLIESEDSITPGHSSDEEPAKAALGVDEAPVSPTVDVAQLESPRKIEDTSGQTHHVLSTAPSPPSGSIEEQAYSPPNQPQSHLLTSEQPDSLTPKTPVKESEENLSGQKSTDSEVGPEETHIAAAGHAPTHGKDDHTFSDISTLGGGASEAQNLPDQNPNGHEEAPSMKNDNPDEKLAGGKASDFNDAPPAPVVLPNQRLMEDVKNQPVDNSGEGSNSNISGNPEQETQNVKGNEQPSGDSTDDNLNFEDRLPMSKRQVQKNPLAPLVDDFDSLSALKEDGLTSPKETNPAPLDQEGDPKNTAYPKLVGSDGSGGNTQPDYISREAKQLPVAPRAAQQFSEPSWLSPKGQPVKDSETAGRHRDSTTAEVSSPIPAHPRFSDPISGASGSSPKIQQVKDPQADGKHRDFSSPEGSSPMPALARVSNYQISRPIWLSPKIQQIKDSEVAPPHVTESKKTQDTPANPHPQNPKVFVSNLPIPTPSPNKSIFFLGVSDFDEGVYQESVRASEAAQDVDFEMLSGSPMAGSSSMAWDEPELRTLLSPNRIKSTAVLPSGTPPSSPVLKSSIKKTSSGMGSPRGSFNVKFKNLQPLTTAPEKTRFSIDSHGTKEQKNTEESPVVPPEVTKGDVEKSSEEEQSRRQKNLVRSKSTLYGLIMMREKQKDVDFQLVKTIRRNKSLFSLRRVDDPTDWSDEEEIIKETLKEIVAPVRSRPMAVRDNQKDVDLLLAKAIRRKDRLRKDPTFVPPTSTVPYYLKKAQIITRQKLDKTTRRIPRPRGSKKSPKAPDVKRLPAELDRVHAFVRRARALKLDKVARLLIQQPALKVHLMYPKSLMPM